ncbi:MAG: SDR family NAD(P)-dependent oxidoreductase [Deltaproteobacteria bacterium]|nr:SDR family NAD(P)-dependent oxidoreductase [Deltaproteobacteria bacterium]
MKLNVTGKTVLITGSAMGIGKGLSHCFARDGADLILADLPREREKLDQWAAELGSRYGINTWTFGIDLTEPKGPETLFREAEATAGGIHILVNNAGICWFGSFAQMPYEERLEKMILLNCMAYAKLARLCLPAMIERDAGGMLFIASVAAFQPLPQLAVYSATKAFTQSLAESIRYELPKRSNVVISVLNPCFTNTALLEDAHFPGDLIPFTLSCNSVDDVVRTGYEAFKKGRMFTVVGWQNKILHQGVVRLLSRKSVAGTARLALRGWSDFLPPSASEFLKRRRGEVK